VDAIHCHCAVYEQRAILCLDAIIVNGGMRRGSSLNLTVFDELVRWFRPLLSGYCWLTL
jgi:hypothetical protein